MATRESLIWDRIEAMLKLRGMTKETLCDRLGISTSTLYEWKNAGELEQPQNLLPLAHALSCDMKFLYAGKGWVGGMEREVEWPDETNYQLSSALLTDEPAALQSAFASRMQLVGEFVAHPAISRGWRDDLQDHLEAIARLVDALPRAVADAGKPQDSARKKPRA